jgi:acetyltransferase-like isoleucine patch superfamily enzyme
MALPMVLPRPVRTYAQNPSRTFEKVAQWLNARWYLRGCDHVAAWVRVTGAPLIQNHGHIIIGMRVQIMSHGARTILSAFGGGTLEIGDRTFVNYGVDIAATRLVRIGADCLIGTHVSIIDTGFHEIVEREREPAPQPVVIQDHVWIGNRAIILPGVTIGEWAVVGAGAVVTSNVAPRTVVAGNPARLLRSF